MYWLRRRPSFLLHVANFLLVVLLPVVIYLGGVRILLSERWVRIEYDKKDFPQDDKGWKREERFRYSVDTLTYLTTSVDIDYLGNNRQDNGRQLFDAKELRHLEDVKNVIVKSREVLKISLLVIAASLIEIMRDKWGRMSLPYTLVTGGLFCLTFTTTLVVGIALFWDQLFTWFHEIFFANGTWTFSASQSLIRLYPERFWVDTATAMVGMSIVASLLLTLSPKFKKLWDK